jgi:DNA-binding CsgD family transcriptional regulator
MLIDAQTRDRLSDLSDRLADFDAASAEPARHHLLGGICELIGASNATWVGAVRVGAPQPRDPVKGWRPRVIRQLHPHRAFERVLKERGKGIDAGQVDPTTIANAAGAGRHRVNLLTDLVTKEWYEGAFYRLFYLDAGYSDAIWAVVPLNKDAESYFGFYRDIGREPFGQLEKETVDQALRGLRWFHRQQFLSEGLMVGTSALTTAERRVLQGLLRGLGDREIAAELGQSEHTTREYVQRLFRKYNVTSRTVLLALWLGRNIP